MIDKPQNDMQTLSLFIDLSLTRFVFENNLNVGIRSLSLVEGETYAITLNAYKNGLEANIDSASLSLADKDNFKVYCDASFEIGRAHV